MARPPTGVQHVLRHGEQELVAVELGAGLRSYAVAGRPVLEGYGPDERPEGGRGQLLVPWPNRVRDGRYAWRGAEQQLALTEPARHNASHGLGRWVSWRTLAAEPDRVVLGLRLAPQPGWPFDVDVEVEHRLDADGLTVTTTATNRGDEPCPWGAGAHPYLTVGTDTVDEAVLHLDASEHLVADERGIPTHAEPVAGGPFDFRRPRAVGDVVLDTAYRGLARDGRGRAHARLSDPDDRAVTLWVDEHHSHLMAFTGDTLGQGRRRRGIALEPMTCPPNALATGEDLRVLAPAERFRAAWGLGVG